MGLKKKEKKRRKKAWASDHEANLHPSLPPTPPESIKEPPSALCSTVLMTSLCKASSPAVPLVLPSAAPGLLKGPEEVETTAVLEEGRGEER